MAAIKKFVVAILFVALIAARAMAQNPGPGPGIYGPIGNANLPNPITVPLAPTTPYSALLGQGTALATSATTDYFYPYLTLAATGTEGSAELPAPQTVTYTKLYCTFSAAQGAAKSDAITLIDVTSACTTPLTCTATNAIACNNAASLGSCAVTAGDLLTYSDVTVGASITARSVTCIAAP